MATPEAVFAQCVRMAESFLVPRSANDKEYFAQDWVAARLEELGYAYAASGRNTYPDFWVGNAEDRFGIEVKSLAFARSRPARTDFDTNSTIPSGEKAGRPVYVAFFLYHAGEGAAPRRIHSLCFFHGDLLNADREIEHENKAIHGFGSYGDAFIRDRKMYVFRTPFTVAPQLLGRFRFIAPDGLELEATDPPLVALGQIIRPWAEERVVGYRIDLPERTAQPETEKSPHAGEAAHFIVWGVA